jgi:uncharacterized protein YkwD
MRPPLLLACLCAFVAFAGGAAAADDPYVSLLAPSGTCGSADDQLDLEPAAAQLVMACLTNYARTHSGLKPLRLNHLLNAAGNAKVAADVACGVFSHEPCGKPFSSVFAVYLRGATSYQLGENIAWGTGSLGTPRQIMNAWLHSPGHRANILTPGFTELGIGYLADQTFLGYDGASLWSQQFGARSPASVAQQTAVQKKRPAGKRLSHVQSG